MSTTWSTDTRQLDRQLTVHTYSQNKNTSKETEAVKLIKKEGKKEGDKESDDY